MADLVAWMPRDAWAGIAEPGRIGVQGDAGVTVTLLGGFGLASLVADAAAAAALSGELERKLGIALPDRPRIVSAAGHDVIGTAPGQWLLRSGTKADIATFMAEWGAFAAISDQSDSRAALRLSGPRARDVLAKGVMIDLHPKTFPVGHAVTTSIAHIGVNLWRMPDMRDGPAFDIMVPRSYAGSFWSWLKASAAEFGCEVSAGTPPATARG